MADEIVYCLNLDLSMCIRDGSRHPVSFKMKPYVATVNKSFQPLPVLCHK